MGKHKPRGKQGGMRTHARSGKTPKSPRLRHIMSLEAQRSERKASPPLPYNDITELFKTDPSSRKRVD